LTFSLKHTNKFYEEKIDDSALQRLSTVKDLRDQKLAFTDHYNSRIFSSFKELDGVIRNFFVSGLFCITRLTPRASNFGLIPEN
jgi:hypothetical protein